MTSKSFPDLRIMSNASQVNDESVWPSFTDIMTVITMVFMMAMVVIAVRNSQLDNQLGIISTNNKNLHHRISMLETSLSQTQLLLQQSYLKNQNLGLNIADLREAKLAVEKKLRLVDSRFAELKQLLVQREAEKVTLQLEKIDIEDKVTSLERLVKQREAEKVTLQQKITSSLENYKSLQQEYSSLGILVKQRESENSALQKQIATSLADYQSLRQEYESLDERYRDLIRPARNSAGKYVVTIYIGKEEGKVEYQYKRPGEAVAVAVSKDNLFKELQKLKNKEGQNLYTRNIVKENSQLTYDEGLKLIREILNKFDYYYQ